MFSHENISHSPQEIDRILNLKLEHKDYVNEKYYSNAAAHKETKLLSRSYMTDILQNYDPSEENFAQYFRRMYRRYLYLDSKDGKYSIYKCDQNEEFYVYIHDTDDFVLLFCCDCK